MAPHLRHLRRLSRRSLLKRLGVAPLLLRPSPLLGEMWWSPAGGDASPEPMIGDLRFIPSYPARSPLEDVLRRVRPGSDEFLTEGYAYEMGLVLDSWSRSLIAGTIDDLRSSLLPTVQFSSFLPASDVKLRRDNTIETSRRSFSTQVLSGSGALLADFERALGVARVLTAEFEITAITVGEAEPLFAETEVRYSLVLSGAASSREQRVGWWSLHWKREASAEISAAWKISRWQTTSEQRGIVRGPGFLDVTEQSMGSTGSYRDQLKRGADEWRSVLDGASGIDVYGNNGVAAGDFDDDGFDDLYVCQPAGLPNRLYRNRGDGTFEDVTERAGVGVLDNTACALFADFRNVGQQDLLVVCGSGPLLFVNQGNGMFQKKLDAFHFAHPPQGTFTHASVADYDRDGRLDVYFCLYSYYLGLDQYHYPAPYFDARNGPPNFLFHNQGDGSFADHTEAAGLNVANDRYSFACAWGEATGDHLPDLYVVNDFGRNNLYRNQGDGTFRSAAGDSHVEDVGAGMSASWGDYNNDGRPDLYVSNMWSAAGQRISQQKIFQEYASEAVRALYQRHARGNALYRNASETTFQNVSQRAGVEVGRWAWCSDFLDFDHDGFEDLYIANGYVTAPEPGKADLPPTHASTGAVRDLRSIDLGSFFWRQVVAKSPNDEAPSLPYEQGWNALNELMRTDSSWSGHERNVLLANNHDGTFTEISGALGLDCLEDGRSFAFADLDGDGRVEIVLKNRSAPQLRILCNSLEGLGDSIAIQLRGTTSNRDAVGASVTIAVNDRQQTKYLQAGSGFLAQHSKTISFGIPEKTGTLQASVRWPSGLVQKFSDLPRNHRLQLTEGTATLVAKPFSSTSPAYNGAIPVGTGTRHSATPRTIDTWLLDPLRAPSFTLPDRDGAVHALGASHGRAVLLYFWSSTSPLCVEQLREFDRKHSAWNPSPLGILAINLDQAQGAAAPSAPVAAGRFSFPSLIATADVAGMYNIIFRYLFDRRRDLGFPTSFLLDRGGMIVKVVQGPVDLDRLLRDATTMPTTAGERRQKALPFPGILYEATFVRNDFTYGVAMFQHGYLEEATISFQQVIAARPDNAEGFYNLGTLSLRRNRFAEARENLEKTVQLKPDYPEAWNNLGMLAAQEGRTEEAIRNFRQSLSLRPAYATALLNLGNLYRHQHDLQQAKVCLNRALSLQPNDPEVNYSVGMLWAQENEVDKASAYLQRALALRPDYPEALNNLGVIAVRKQDFAMAQKQFETSIQLSPEFADAYLNLARLYMLQHDKAKAQKALEDLLRVNPQSAAAKQGIETLNAIP